MIFKLFVINQLQILFFFLSLCFQLPFDVIFEDITDFDGIFSWTQRTKIFFSKLSKFFDIFLVSVFNWELFWFSSNSLKKYANLAKFSLKRSDLIDFWRQNDNSGNDVLSWLQTQKSLVWTFIWILDFMSVNLDLLPWVFIFGPILIGWTFGPLLTDLDLWMCHFGPEYLDLFRPLLFIMKGEFSC